MVFGVEHRGDEDLRHLVERDRLAILGGVQHGQHGLAVRGVHGRAAQGALAAERGQRHGVGRRGAMQASARAHDGQADDGTGNDQRAGRDDGNEAEGPGHAEAAYRAHASPSHGRQWPVGRER